MISFTWNHSINDRCEFGLRGTNKAVDKAKFLETNNCSSILETLIKDYQIVNVRSRQTEGEWWYRYYSLNATSIIDEFLDSLSDLYVSLYKELS